MEITEIYVNGIKFVSKSPVELDDDLDLKMDFLNGVPNKIMIPTLNPTFNGDDYNHNIFTKAE